MAPAYRAPSQFLRLSKSHLCPSLAKHNVCSSATELLPRVAHSLCLNLITFSPLAVFSRD